LRKVLRWEPQISLEEGLKHTYLWIDRQVRAAELGGAAESLENPSSVGRRASA